jgi:hypothetical protein
LNPTTQPPEVNTLTRKILLKKFKREKTYLTQTRDEFSGKKNQTERKKTKINNTGGKKYDY